MQFEKLDLNNSKLPTRRDVIEYLLYLKHHGTEKIKKNQATHEYLQHAMEKVVAI